MSEEIKIEEPAIRETSGRNPDGTFMPGVSGNPAGRPKGTMKDYFRRKFMNMTDEEKAEFSKEVSHEMQIRFGEGNPHQTNETDIKGNLAIEISKEVAEKNVLTPSAINSSQGSA